MCSPSLRNRPAKTCMTEAEHVAEAVGLNAAPPRVDLSASQEAERVAFDPLGEAKPLNTQLFANSPERFEPTPEDDFHGARDPNLAIQHENSRHRLVVYLKATGLSNNEIAERTGFTVPWVSQILRQRWARARLVEEMKACGRDAITSLLQGAAEDSVHRLIFEKDNEQAKPSERIAAANSLLDRFLGKPTMRVESASTVTHVSSDMTEVDQQIKELEEQERLVLRKN